MSDSKKPKNKSSWSSQLAIIIGIVLFGATQGIHNKIFNGIDNALGIAIGIVILILLFVSRAKKRKLQAKTLQKGNL